MIGRRLTQLLIAKEYEVIIMSRHSSTVKHPLLGVAYAAWDIGSQTIDKTAIEKADHIIHLAGAGVADKRWSKNRKLEIISSRTQTSSLIVKALAEIPNHVKTVVSASAIGWYGADTDLSRINGFTEEAPPDTAFLGETCRLWEESIQPVQQLGKRLVKLRTGIVLSNEGGALKEFKKPLRAGIATILGSGRQMISWIHVDDLCRMYIHAIENKEMQGAYNAVSPNPVTNKELILRLARHMRGKFYLPVHVPSWVLSIALGEMSIEVLKSATVSCRKVQTTGFDFQYPNVKETF
jgi:uncharacterized protein (TIGR01777 family)